MYARQLVELDYYDASLCPGAAFEPGFTLGVQAALLALKHDATMSDEIRDAFADELRALGEMRKARRDEERSLRA